MPTHAFADQYWGRQPLLTAHSQLHQDFSDLFSPGAVDELVAERAIRTPFVRMANKGALLAPSRYTSGGGYGAEISDQLDSEKVLGEFANGSTLVLQGLHRTWPALATFIRQLDADLGCSCQVNAYITPASARGFDPHYDVHDVFVIQIHGEKAWTIHEPVYPDPLPTQPWSDYRAEVAEQAAGAPYLQQTFAPGDVLYLPRGWIHSATALGGTSIHLTIGVSSRTRYDVARQLLADLAGNPNLRQSLPLGFGESGPDAEREIVQQTCTALTDALTADGFVDAFVTRLAGTVPGPARAAPIRPLATIDALDRLAADTTIAWRPGLGARIVTEGSLVRIELASKTVALPIEATDSLTALHSGVPEKAGRLPGLDAVSSLVVTRRLLREAILVLA
ncbi:MAG: cupin domain-containing protein [Microbacteriaceae bacterium]